MNNFQKEEQQLEMQWADGRHQSRAKVWTRHRLTGKYRQVSVLLTRSLCRFESFFKQIVLVSKVNDSTQSLQRRKVGTHTQAAICIKGTTHVRSRRHGAGGGTNADRDCALQR
ncbi:hypothetical protein GHT06_021334 [Daphnia sinensis]|uniref:Uncharacterized protein n=1 Tax=Daphnia sinensis TaxID=1820382 RepID=A0AAD5L996_9CRUS|nr:hypothetical protein GHT06_021334 [Daphnia sinensis]